jgi:hypothetical protein
MTEFVKEPITLTITEIETALVNELITIESLEFFFTKKCLREFPIPVSTKDTTLKESIERSMGVSLEEKKTLYTEIQQIKMDPIQTPPITSNGVQSFTSLHSAFGYRSQQNERSIQIKQPIKLLHPRFIQIPKQSPQKYIHHLRKMF